MERLNKLLAQDVDYFDKDDFRENYCYEGTL